jgi:hypothetical protein
MIVDDEHTDWVTSPLWADVRSPSPIGHFQIPSDEDAVPGASSHVPGENADRNRRNGRLSALTQLVG